MPRLRTVSPTSRGWTRKRNGRGFAYVDHHGARLPPEDVARIRALVIPPAWEHVWIGPYANAHIQAVGTDVAGRRQYLYHPQWREERNQAKHERVLKIARRLPKARTVVDEHLVLEGMPYERALATAFRLLDLGFFRVGGESYAEANDSYGLATIQKRHVRISGDLVAFDYVAKSGKERVLSLSDPPVIDALRVLTTRRGGGEELLAYRQGRHWRDVSSTDVNDYVKEVVGGDVSAKDFRTWHATVLAAVALAVSTHAADSPTARKRAVRRALVEVSDYLGNTPTVARASYVDPRVIDLFEDGVTIERSLRTLGEDASFGQPATHGATEQAVLRMLARPPSATERAARR